MAFDIKTAKPDTGFDITTARPDVESIEKSSLIDFNAPSIPIKSLGGKLLDTTTRMVGAGEDRGIIKQNLPRTYGALKSVAERAEQLTTPTNVGLGLGIAAGGPLVATGAGIIFATKTLLDLFKSAPEKYREYKDAVQRNDLEKQSEIVTGAGLDAGLTGLLSKQVFKGVKELPPMPSIPKPNLGALTVRGRTEKLVNEIPSKIEAKTGVQPVPQVKAGQEIQSSFERGFGKQEAGFEQSYQDALASKTQEMKLAQTAKEGRFTKGIEDIAKKYGDETIGLAEGGQPVAKNFEKTLSGYKTISKKLYEKLDKVSGTAPAKVEGQPLKSEGLIKDIFEQRGIDSPNTSPAEALKFEGWSRQLQKDHGLSPSQIKQVLNQTDELASSRFTSDVLDQSTLNAYKMMNNVLEKLQNPNLTVHDLSLIGSDVNRFAYSRINDPIRNVYKALSNTIKEDIADGATRAGFGDLSNNSRAVWRKLKTLEDSPTAKIIEGDPEYIVPKIAKANSPTRVNELMENIEPSARNTFKKALLDSYKEKSGGDIGAMSKLILSKTKETNRAIFGDDAPLLERYAKFGEIVNETKGARAIVQKAEPFTPTELGTANIVRNKLAGDIIDSLVKGADETRIKSAINYMDESGRSALRSGLYEQIKQNPKVLKDIPNPVLDVIYRENSKFFKAYKDILNAKESKLKEGFLENIAEIVLPGYPTSWWGRIKKGVRGISNKATFESSIKEQRKVFNEKGKKQ